MREFLATQWAIEMNPSIKGTLLLIRTTTGPFIMVSAFLYEYLRLGSTVRRPGLIRYYGDQFAADGDKAYIMKQRKWWREKYMTAQKGGEANETENRPHWKGFLKVPSRKTSGKERGNGRRWQQTCAVIELSALKKLPQNSQFKLI